jgi:hypothetical protein
MACLNKMPEREAWIQTKYKTFFAGNACWLVVGAIQVCLALFQGRGGGGGMILSRVAVGVNVSPLTFILSPS